MSCNDKHEHNHKIALYSVRYTQEQAQRPFSFFFHWKSLWVHVQTHGWKLEHPWKAKDLLITHPFTRLYFYSRSTVGSNDERGWCSQKWKIFFSQANALRLRENLQLFTGKHHSFFYSSAFKLNLFWVLCIRKWWSIYKYGKHAVRSVTVAGLQSAVYAAPETEIWRTGLTFSWLVSGPTLLHRVKLDKLPPSRLNSLNHDQEGSVPFSPIVLLLLLLLPGGRILACVE